MNTISLVNSKHSEQTLLAKARDFEESALAEIYDCYSPGIYRYAMRLLGEPSQAEECVAETFSRFLSAVRHGGGPSEHLQAYLYRVAHNWITDFYRRQPPADLPLDLTTPSGNPELGQGLEEKQVQNVLRTALQHLTPEQRQVIVLKYLEDQTNEEISRATGRTVDAVKALQHRGLAALRRLLSMAEEAEK